MAGLDDVRQASRQFYAALNQMAQGNSSAMAEVWSHAASVTAMHPIGGREVGWDAVRGSFEQVAKLSSGGQIELAEQQIQLAGDVAYEIGIERGQITLGGHQAAIDQRVTNIYQRQQGAWKLVHHHADISPAMLDVLKRL